MSSPVHCPVCDVLVTETGWGDEAGQYECRDCGTEFGLYRSDDGALRTVVLS